jgi:hypothetical protein
VEELIEIRVPDETEDLDHSFVTTDWARRWPAEEAWRARRR